MDRFADFTESLLPGSPTSRSLPSQSTVLLAASGALELTWRPVVQTASRLLQISFPVVIMTPCAYCNVLCNPTREHVIPDWYAIEVGKDDLSVFNARSPLNHLEGDIIIKDVCEQCNNGPLSSLDAYGKSLFLEAFKHQAYLGESREFSCDYDLLVRWLLKLSYNSARVHAADVEILTKFAPYIRGQATCPSEVRVFVHLICPTDYSTDPPSSSRRILGKPDYIEEVQWFRLVQMRLDTSHLTEVVQRQVYIHAFCFTLLVPDPNRPEHTDDLDRIESSLREFVPSAVRVSSSGQLKVRAGDVHMHQAIATHYANYPVRYLGSDSTESFSLSEVIRTLSNGTKKGLIFRIPREEVEAGDIATTANCLACLIVTAEAAAAVRQKIGLCIDGYDDDPRELWQIQESWHWIRQLYDEFPEITYLAMPESKTLKLFAACYCRDDTLVGNRLQFNKDRLKKFLELGFEGLNAITQRYAFSIDLNKKISNDVLDTINSFYRNS